MRFVFPNQRAVKISEKVTHISEYSIDFKNNVEEIRTNKYNILAT